MSERLTDGQVEDIAMGRSPFGVPVWANIACELAQEVKERRDKEPTFTSVVHQCCEDRQVLLEALREAREMLADWSQYADPYFRAKHKLNDDLAEVDAVISRFTSP